MESSGKGAETTICSSNTIELGSNDTTEDTLVPSCSFDFSSLPDVTWVKIMQYLSIRDRYTLSLTCKSLNDAFNHPSLWHTAEICFIGGVHNYRRDNVVSSAMYLGLVKHFGRYFQDLSIRIGGHFVKFPVEWSQIFKELGKQCRLESLTLEIGILTSDFHHYGHSPSTFDVKALLSFVANAFRMKRLAIQSWPMFDEIIETPETNIFRVLMLNKRLKDIESLSLFWSSATGWSERKPVLNTPEMTLELVNHFQNLTSLSLRSPMLSEDVLNALCSAGRTRLKLLQIFVNFVKGDSRFKMPIISSKSWSDLLKFCPELSVECTVFSRVSHMDLASLLKPEVPLHAIRFMQYSRCDGLILSSLSDKYQNVLQTFVSYCDSSDVDRYLVDLVSKCTKLIEFVYHGNVKTSIVERLVLLRGERWSKFEVLEKTLTVEDEWEDVPDDQVLAPGPDGQHILVGLMRHHKPEEVRDEKIAHMTHQVSQALGYTWTPTK